MSMSDFDKQLKELENAVKTGEVAPSKFKPGANIHGKYQQQQSSYMLKMVMLSMLSAGSIALVVKFWPEATLQYMPSELKTVFVKYMNIEDVKLDGEMKTPGTAAAPTGEKKELKAKELDLKNFQFVEGQSFLPAELEKSNDYVKIDGRYYKRRPDNIYIINGERIFAK